MKPEPLTLPHPAPGAAAEIVLSTHALERFSERSGRGLSLAAAEAQIRGMWSLAEFTTEPPSWVLSVQENAGYVVIADVAFPLAQDAAVLVAKTAIFRTCARKKKARYRSGPSRRHPIPYVRPRSSAGAEAAAL